jgi:hypothetical protein
MYPDVVSDYRQIDNVTSGIYFLTARSRFGSQRALLSFVVVSALNSHRVQDTHLVFRRNYSTTQGKYYV